MSENEKVIRFSHAQDVMEFVDAADACDFDIDVYYDRAVIDAKSILAMLAIGAQNELIIRYGGRNEKFEKVTNKFAIA